MSSASNSPKPIEFKGATLGVLTAYLRETEPAALADALHKMMGGLADFFGGEATVLDFSQLPAAPERLDWAGLLSLLRRYRMQPIGVRALPEAFQAGARQAGLAVLAGDLGVVPAAPAPVAAPAPAPTAPAPRPAPAARSMVVERYLRTGQQIYAKGADLILLGGLSNGAEVIADGNIHCYGPLRGRAIAGAQGDAQARILTSNFGPELVAIAGVYRTFENGVPRSVAAKGAQVRLQGTPEQQKLEIEPLQLD
jgi:septum site-determining protein MinC